MQLEKQKHLNCPALLRRSGLGLVRVYNLLPGDVVAEKTVRGFQIKLQKLVRGNCWLQGLSYHAITQSTLVATRAPLNFCTLFDWPAFCFFASTLPLDTDKGFKPAHGRVSSSAVLFRCVNGLWQTGNDAGTVCAPRLTRAPL